MPLPDEAALRRIEAWVSEFDRDWAEGRLTAQAGILPPAGDPLRLPALVALVRCDLARRWERGRRVRVEDYLGAFPELAAPEALTQLAEAEYQTRRRHGSQADLDDFTSRFAREGEGWRPLPPAVAETLAEPPSDAAPTRLPSESGAAPDGSFRERLGRYRILRKLGEGGMGAVYLAHDTELDRQVALKVPRFGDDDPDGKERFLREARAAATLSHPNLCPVHDVGRIDNVLYLTMAFIEGRPLSELARKGNLLPPREAIELVRRLALAVEEAHRKGVIHRDLKPSNVMLDSRGEPVLMDFGLARRSAATDLRLTRSGAVLGTPAYMAPEQVRGDVEAHGPATDVYSLGVILHELLTGELPFQGSVGVVMSQVLTQDPPPVTKARPDLDPALDVVCRKAMAKRPGDRFVSMREFADALQRPLQGVSPQARFSASRRVRLVAAGLLLGVLLAAGVVFSLNTRLGKVRIEVNDPSATVLIDGAEVRIDTAHEPITLTPGRHGLVVKKGDVVVETRDFTVLRGENPVLKVTLPENRLAIPEGRTHGLVAGVNRYDHADVLPDLQFAEADARVLTGVLGEGVVLLSTGQQGRPHLQPRRVHFLRELRALAGACSQADVLLVAFSGREVLLAGDPEYYLGLADADPRDRESLLPLSQVYREMARSKARLKLLVLDSCRVSPMGDATRRPLLPPAGVTAFYSCSDGEYAYEDAEHGQGIFSYYFAEGLRGSADADRDGRVTLAELCAFIEAGVVDHVRRKLKTKQNPQFVGSKPDDFAFPVPRRR